MDEETYEVIVHNMGLLEMRMTRHNTEIVLGLYQYMERKRAETIAKEKVTEDG